MANYREISQIYAQGAIKACFLLNGGAAVALLTQVAKLIDAGYKDAVANSMVIWAFGTLAAAATWVVGFLSVRYVDKSERENGKERENLSRSNFCMNIGIGLVLVSLASFLSGVITLFCKL